MKDITQYIKKRIQEEISNHTIDCAHDITQENVHNHLIEPKFEKYLDPLDSKNVFEIWTVLEEDPIDQKGYTIFYQEEEDKFGLGTHTSDGLVHLGLYGSFVKTLNSM